MAEKQKISPELFDMRQKGALTVSVTVIFTDEDARESFEHEAFAQTGRSMKTMAGFSGELDLHALESLENDERIVSVEPNHTISVPQDPTVPQ